jgi:hypothetical protein
MRTTGRPRFSRMRHLPTGATAGAVVRCGCVQFAHPGRRFRAALDPAGRLCQAAGADFTIAAATLATQQFWIDNHFNRILCDARVESSDNMLRCFAKSIVNSTLVLLAALSLSACADSGPPIGRGGPRFAADVTPWFDTRVKQSFPVGSDDGKLRPNFTGKPLRLRRPVTRPLASRLRRFIGLTK